jgi:hypothetical protein
LTGFRGVGHCKNMSSRWLAYLSLILALLLTQQGAVLHALSHVPGQVPAHSHADDKQLPHNPACEKCVAYAAFGGALGSKPLFITAPLLAAIFVAMPFIAFAPAFLRAYPARAPPFPF